MLFKSRLCSLVSTVALAAIVLSVPISVSAAETSANVPSSEGIKLTINGSKFDPNSDPFIDNGAVYLPVRDIGELLGTVVAWTSSTKKVTMTYPKLTVKLNYGSMEATVNVSVVNLTAPLRMVNGRVYVPSEVTGAGVDWNGSTQTVSITKSDDLYVKGGGVNITTWLNRRTGDLYIAHPYEQSPAHVGKLDAEFHDHVSSDTVLWSSGNMVVTVIDKHEEQPHNNYDTYSVLVRDNKIVSKMKASYSYFQRYEQNVNYRQYFDPTANKWVENTFLTDGRTLTVFNDKAEVVNEYDLPSLVGKDEVYTVLGVGDDYLVVRPNQTGFLTLVNLKDKTTVVLCEKLLSGKDLDYARNNDVPYHGDELKFAGESLNGEQLFFSYNSPIDGKNNEYIQLTYNLNTADYLKLAPYLSTPLAIFLLSI